MVLQDVPKLKTQTVDLAKKRRNTHKMTCKKGLPIHSSEVKAYGRMTVGCSAGKCARKEGSVCAERYLEETPVKVSESLHGGLSCSSTLPHTFLENPILYVMYTSASLVLKMIHLVPRPL